MSDFFAGGAATLAWLAALLFFRFWRGTSDRLFGLFGVAFALLGLNWFLVSAIHPNAESQHYLYFLRMLAFVTIIAAIADKNRRARGPS